MVRYCFSGNPHSPIYFVGGAISFPGPLWLSDYCYAKASVPECMDPGDCSSHRIGLALFSVGLGPCTAMVQLFGNYGLTMRWFFSMCSGLAYVVAALRLVWLRYAASR